ncbi:arginase family protein [Geodermatophilus sp. CPCC 206100]|uniref:arginase family protein n=1 Tax=Geodermatophilus sp. CPCC 206100 TaxID=3020054 RepID=UPI003AFF900B
MLEASAVTWLRPAQARDPAAVEAALTGLAARVDAVHWHVDLDVHDPPIASANGYAARGGLTAEEVHDLLRRTAVHLPVVSATLASYDPSYDPEGRLRGVALDLLEAIAEAAGPL